MKPNKFSRFYVLLKCMPGFSEELKEQLISQFTKGRTTSLQDITEMEYKALCGYMQSKIEKPADQAYKELRARRSEVLKMMQKMGVDTSEWAAVDSYCLNPRIAGKVFRELTVNELNEVKTKLWAIRRKDENKGIVRLPKYMLN